ncbi:hypothetical protein M408DRAFT_331945 [Serendipita vermifera MAFF 305830]|uniref:RING-type E3 ubiquitin transferase n=1 Tax=Serendipita vermifera MAFF 305830 TaxID=933852 RepID=A0A0C3AHT4_SERVB|nr:hypothetical protein M408DRAFT_331945 [Serendipita vermifera MAFF 305830]
MDNNAHAQAAPIAGPTQQAASSARAGNVRPGEEKRIFSFEDSNWRESELHGLDFIDVDEDEDLPRAKRRSSSSNKGFDNLFNTRSIFGSSPEPAEPDTCRICSGPAEPGMPLYHPCKCSGTIRHVHQDCLKSWLDTSHRTRCDLCNHTFTYKKLYSVNMPTTLPARVVIGPMLKQVGKWTLVFLRLVLVGTVWLALLPALLHWCWRVGFWLSDYVSLRLSGKLYYLELYGPQYLNTTDVVSEATSAIMPSTTFSSNAADTVPVEVTFPPSLLQALSTAFPTHEPLSSAISSLQSILQKNQPTPTDPSPTPHPNAAMMSSAFSHIASLLEENKHNLRRSRFRPRRVLPGEEYASLRQFALSISGKAMFGQDSSFIWDMARLWYYMIRHTCLWIVSTMSTALVYPYHASRHLFNSANAIYSNTTWQRIDEIAEQLTTPIVTGQIIAVAIVVAFVLLFFLREWVIVNAEPGMFEDPAPEGQAAEDGNRAVAQQAQQPNLIAIGNVVPGAFPPDPPAPPPNAAPRPAEWERDVDLAEPRPPSPNIISQEEQEQLMKEVMDWRREQDEVISKSKAEVDEWQWGKKKVIIDDWKEQKMKAIKDKVAPEDDVIDNLDGNATPPVRVANPFDKGKGKGKRIFDERDLEVEKFEFRNLDAVEDNGADVEYIEVLQRPTRKVPHLPKRYEGNSLATTSTQRKASPFAGTPPAMPDKGLANFEFSFSASRSLPRTLPTEPVAVTSFRPDTFRPLPPSIPHLQPSRPLFPPANVKESIVDSEKNEETAEEGSNSLSDAPSSLPVSMAEAAVNSSQQEPPVSSTLAEGVRTSPEKKSSVANDNPMDGEPFTIVSPFKLALPPFSSLVPPAPPSPAPSKLPFSVRDFKIAPLEQAMPKVGSTSSSVPAGLYEMRPNDEFDDALQTELTPNPTQPSIQLARKRSNEGSKRRIRSRVRAGPFSSFSNVQNLANAEELRPSPIFVVPTVPAAYPSNYETMRPLVLAGQSDESVLETSRSRPFVFHAPSNTSGSSGYPSPSGHETQKPSLISSTSLNIHAKPFQPVSISAPITPSELGSFGSIPKGFTASQQPLGHNSFANVASLHQSDATPFAYAPFDRDSTNPLIYRQAGDSFSAGAASQPKGLPHIAPGFGYTPARTTFTANGPLHGHHMSMGMVSDTGDGSPTQNPVDLPFVRRGRALTAGANEPFPPGRPPTQPLSGLATQPGAQSHQRSSSLSTHLTSSSRARPEDNHLLRPSSSSSGDSSAASATFSPMPWYGLPDSRPDIDRKKLEEMERRELLKAQHKAISAAAKGKGRGGNTEEVRQSKARVSPPELVILSSRTQKPAVVPPQDGLAQLPSVTPSSSRSVEIVVLGQPRSNSFEPGQQKPVDDRTSLPTPALFSSSSQLPSKGTYRANIAETSGTEPADSVVKVASIPPASLLAHENRKRAPGLITIPKFDTIMPNGQSSNPLKRPSLPSAASPIIVEERPSSQMALYQPPEEFRPLVRQSNGEGTTPDSSLPPLMDYYFQPLDRGLGTNATVHLHPRDEPEALQMLAEPENNIEVPLVLDDDLPDLEGLPEDEVVIEGQEAIIDIANAAEPPAPAPPPAEDVWDDEWTHLLEAVGMTGPWYCIVQNAALVIVIFNVTLGVGIFMPYILGRTASLIVVNPSDVVATLATPGDRPGFLGQQFPPIWKPRQGASFSLMGKGIALLFGDLVPSLKYVTAIGQKLACSYLSTADRLFGFIHSNTTATNLTASQGHKFVSKLWSVIRPTSVLSATVDFVVGSIRWYQMHMPCHTDGPAASSLVNMARAFDYAVCSFFPDALQDPANGNRVFYHWMLTSLRDVASDRTLAVLFGYLITVAGLAVHTRITMQKSSYMVLMLFKVACFVLFEAVIKPLLFGFVIDIFTLSLFPGVSVQSRISFWNSAPYSNLFHHWLVGNVVVVQFLYFLQDLQKALRPGALLQVRKVLDPATPSIREMISKSIMWHSLKYALTLTSNLCLLWIVLGLTIDVNNLLTSNFVPLRWDLRRPLSDVPIDLIILHIFLPATFRFLKLKRIIRNTVKTFFTEWSRFLNLQSVILGETLIDPVAGSYWRVPVAEDAIRLAGRPSAIQTDALGNGLTQEDRDMIDLQIFASRKSQRIPQNDYKVVFYPDHYRVRIGIFLIVLWAAFFGTAWTSITLPIRIGRLTFKLLLNKTDVHDAYSWIVGLYLFWFASFVKYLVGREQRRWSKYLSTRTRNAFPVKLFVRHTAAMLGRLALAVMWLVFLLPLLIGLFFEIYLVVPLTYHLHPGLTPTVRLADAWAGGMIIGAIVLRAARLGQPDQLPELFDRIRREGWFKIKARALASELGPITAGLIGLVIGPLILQILLPAWLGDEYARGSAVLKVFLPTLIVMAVMSTLVTTAHGLLYLWVEAIRDQQYLDKEIIQNLEDSPADSM